MSRVDEKVTKELQIDRNKREIETRSNLIVDSRFPVRRRRRRRRRRRIDVSL